MVQFWFGLRLKFNSFELDTEVGRLFFSLKPGADMLSASAALRPLLIKEEGR